MKTPTRDDQIRCVDLRIRSKQGSRLSPDDMKFVKQMFREFPEWYSSTNEEVFYRSAPFGAQLPERGNP
jgi:hypothetical protein